MRIRPDQLISHGYRPLRSVRYSEIAQFAVDSLFTRNPFSLGFALMMAAIVGYALVVAFGADATPGALLLAGLRGAGLGLAGALLLVPVHELVHGAAFRLLGADRVAYGLEPAAYAVFAVAPGFVMSAREVMVAVFAPLVIMSAALLTAHLSVSDLWAGAALGALFFHTLFCAGDIGIAAYVWRYRRQGLVTYDELEPRLSHFFIRAGDTPNDRSGRVREHGTERHQSGSPSSRGSGVPDRQSRS